MSLPLFLYLCQAVIYTFLNQAATLSLSDDESKTLLTQLLDDMLPRYARPEQGGCRITTPFLQSLTPGSCKYRFQCVWHSLYIKAHLKPSFFANEIIELADVLQIPDPFITKSCFRFSSIEALALLLARLRSAGDIFDLVVHYDHPQSAISEVVHELSDYIDRRWGYLLDLDARNCHELSLGTLCRLCYHYCIISPITLSSLCSFPVTSDFLTKL